MNGDLQVEVYTLRNSHAQIEARLASIPQEQTRLSSGQFSLGVSMQKIGELIYAMQVEQKKQGKLHDAIALKLGVEISHPTEKPETHA